MEVFERIRRFLAGRKTYLTALAAIITALAAWASGEMTGKELVVAVYAAVQTIWLRAAVKKAER